MKRIFVANTHGAVVNVSLHVHGQKVDWLCEARVVDLYWPFAYNGMLADAAGSVYGATVHVGVDGEGAIY
jgi:hypothetical protein